MHYLLLNFWQKNRKVRQKKIKACVEDCALSASSRSMSCPGNQNRPPAGPYFCTFPVALVGFAQALSGLPAARSGVEGCHHLTGSVTQAPLYTVGIIQLLHLEKATSAN